MQTIDHDPDEKPLKAKPMPWLEPLAFFVVAGLWVWFFNFETPHWASIGIGFGTGGMLMAWACEKWGRKPYRDLLSDERASD